MHWIQCAYYRLLIAARLDPDGNEISTDEEEVLERARTVIRRNNPQPFFNLFRPVVRASNDNPTNSRGDNTGTPEAQIPPQSGSMNTAQPSDTTESTPEVARFRRIRRGTNTDSIVSI